MLRAVRYGLEYALFRLLLAMLQALSPRAGQRLADGLAWFLHRVVPGRLTRRSVAEENLRLAFGDELTDADRDRIIYGMWRHLFCMLTEIGQLHRLTLSNMYDTIEFRNKREVVQALTSGRPVLVLSGHFGNWELAISVFGLFGFPMGVVARELENPHLNDWFRRFREATGHRMIAKRECFEELLERLEHGGSVALLGDQDAGRGGVFADFFGTPASCPKTIALLAQQYDALICVGYAYRVAATAGGSRFELGCEEVIDPRTIAEADLIRELTQRYTAALERVVRRAPEQYFWVHRRWKSKPKQRTRKQKAAARAA